MKDKISELQETVKNLRGVWYGDISSPKGLPYDVSREKMRTQGALTLAVESHNLLEELQSHLVSTEIMSELSHITRDVDKGIRQDGWNYNLDPVKAHMLMSKAEAIRKKVLADKTPIAERVRQGRLYVNNTGDIFAAQIREPDRGCSASICSNCDEPIAFSDYSCETCGYELIGAHGMVNVYLWNRLSYEKRSKVIKSAYGLMIRDIEQRGDWRGCLSPLNRFNPDLLEIRRRDGGESIWLNLDQSPLFGPESL